MASDPLDLSFSDDTNDPDGRLADLLAEYLERHASGESITEKVVRSEHPEEAAELLPELRALQALSSESEDSAAPRRLGDYRLVRRIGRGGMGVVYEAVQESMDRRVALKVLPSGVLGDARNLSRFIREAKIAGQLHHPNIVPVHGLGAEADSPYFAMELVDGDTLARVVSRLRKSRDKPEAERSRVLSGVLRRFRSSEIDTGVGARKVEDSSASSSTDASNDLNDLPVTALDADEVTPAYCYRLADAFAAVAEGLQHAHARGIIHRDIKPSNLILDRDGRLRILDFGLARREGQEGLTLTGDLIGTVLYMSPEQAMARQAGVDHLTDIYSLGATLYELLAWHPPFEGKDYHDTLGQIISREARPLRNVNPRIPADLETIVSKCMRKEPGERYLTADALAQDLRRFVRGDPIEARPQTGLEKLVRQARRHRGKALAASLVLALLVSVAWIAIKAQRDDRLSREAAYAPKVHAALEWMRLSRMAGLEAHKYKLGVYPWGFHFIHSINAEIGLPEKGALRPLRQAVDELTEAVLSLPARADAYWHRARAQLLLGDENAALDDLVAATRIDPELVPALLLRASILERRGELDLSAPLKTRVEELTAREGWARSWLAAQRASWNRKWTEAAESFGESLRFLEGQIEPYVGWSLEARLGRGVAFLSAEDKAIDALIEFVTVRHQWPDAEEVALLEAAAFLRLGEEQDVQEYITRAEDSFERLFLESPFRGKVAIAVKGLYGLSGFAHRPSAIPPQWIERIPSPVREVTRAWDICMELGECDTAVAELEGVLELYPQHAPLWREVGRAFFAFGTENKSEEWLIRSVDVLRDSLKLEPDSPIGKLRLGQVLASRRGQYKSEADAIEALNLAVAVEESNPELSFEVARILQDLGQLREAQDLYTHALESESHSPIACNNAIAGVLEDRAKEETGDEQTRLYTLALEARNEALSRNPRARSALWQRGEVLLALERKTDAFESFRRACAEPPPSAKMHWFLGSRLEAHGEPPAFAFEAYVDGLEINPTSGPLITKINALLDRRPRVELNAGPEQLISDLVETLSGELEASPRGRLVQLLLRAQLYLEQDEAALATIELAHEACRGVHPGCFNNLAYLLERGGKLQSAFESYLGAIEIVPTEKYAHGRLRVFLGRYPRIEFEDAPKELITVLEEAIAEAETRNGETEATKQEREQRVSMLDTLAAAQGYVGEDPAEERTLQKILKLLGASPESASFRDRLGDVYRDRGELEKALGQYVSAIDARASIAYQDAIFSLLEQNPDAKLEPAAAAGAQKVQKILGPELEPEASATVHAVLGALRFRAQDADGAVRALEAATRLTTSSQPLYSPLLAKYRRALAPDLASYASIDSILDSPEELIPEGASWRFFRGLEEPSPAMEWTKIDFDDSGWEQGASGFGFGDEDDRTLLDDMKGNYTTVYLRRAFDLPDSEAPEQLVLRVRVDDGCMIYLNGREIGRFGVAGEPGEGLPFDATAERPVPEPLRPQIFELEAEHLRPGRNALALQGLNQNIDSSDFSLIPELLAKRSPSAERDQELLEPFRLYAGERAGDPGTSLRWLYARGRLLQRAGKYSEATAVFKDLSGRDTESPEPRSRLAECQRAKGDAPATRD